MIGLAMTRSAYSYLRISSQDQAKGGGIDRQLKATRDYVEKHGLVLVDEISDIGKSGYHGKHVSEGNFGTFLEAVKDGTIKPGSVLIVESLDRLSRENILVAQQQLSSLIQAGIEVVTLIDNRVYNSNVTTGDLIISLIDMERSHKESLVKSERTNAANLRRDKTILAGGKSYLYQCPKWIKQNKVANHFEFEIIAEKVAVINRVFSLYLSGYGYNKICQILNADDVPPLGISKLWTVSSVSFLLQNEMVTGAVKVGDEVIADYLPEIISPTTFWKVQDRIKNQKGRVGRKGRTYSNLFQGMIVCHSCSEPVIVTRSTGPKKLKYYACSNQTIGGNCHRTGTKRSIPLKMVETAVLKNVNQYHLEIAMVKVDPSILITDKNSLQNQITALQKSEQNLMASLRFADDDDQRQAIVNDAIKIKVEIRELKAKIDVIDADLFQLEKDKARKDEIDISEIQYWDTMNDGDLYASRQKINGIVSQLISQVRVDIDLQEVNVVLGGMIKWWNIDIEGNILHFGDWSRLPLETIIKRATEYFKKVDVKLIERVYGQLSLQDNKPLSLK